MKECMSQTESTAHTGADHLNQIAFDRSLINPDRLQTIDHQGQSTSDRFLKSSPESTPAGQSTKKHIRLLHDAPCLSAITSLLPVQISTQFPSKSPVISSISSSQFAKRTSLTGKLNCGRLGKPNFLCLHFSRPRLQSTPSHLFPLCALFVTLPRLLHSLNAFV